MKKFRKILLVSLFIALPSVCAWLYVNATGKWAWDAYRRRHQASGDSLELKTYIPPSVPDEGNFAMTPLLNPIFAGTGEYAEGLSKKLKLPAIAAKPSPTLHNSSLGDRALGKRVNLDEWKTAFGGQDVLVALQKYDPELQEITQAVRRPYSRFPIAYDKGLEMSLPHLGVIDYLAKLYTLRASAELRSGNADAALEDVQTILHLVNSVKNEPVLVSHLVRMQMCQDGLQMVWEGLEDHRWTDAQLTVLQSALGDDDSLKSLSLAFRGQRAGIDDIAMNQPEQLNEYLGDSLDEMSPWHRTPALDHIPKGLIFYQNLLELNRNYDTLLDAIDPVARRIDPDRFRSTRGTLHRAAERSLFGIWLPNPNNAMAKTEVDMSVAVAMRAAYAQVSTDEAVIACALERYRLANGQFPDALGKLVPAYAKALPHDIITGGPLHYRTTGAAGYVLYSVGWNGTDEGGTVATMSDGDIDFTQGDWVWAIGQK